MTSLNNSVTLTLLELKVIIVFATSIEPGQTLYRWPITSSFHYDIPKNDDGEFKNERLIIPFKKYSRLRLNFFLTFYSTDVLTMKRREQSKSVLESFSSMIKRMVGGEVFQFTGDVRSDRLTETLSELRALEKENKLAVTGSVRQDDKDFEDILKRLLFIFSL